MDLYEYQARDLFEKYEVPVLAGIVADTSEEVKAAAEKLGGVVVVKAQVKTGGRGKAGGVKVAKTPDEAYEAAKAILGLDIKGHVVKRVMVAAGASIEKEFYFSVLLDRSNRSYLSLASVEGGMEIEQLAVEKPEALARIEVNALTGIDKTKAVEIARAANFPEELVEKVADVFVKLYAVYTGEGATLVEVNPLILDGSGNIIALDGKVTLDDNATEVRHPEHEELEDKDAADPLEAKAKAAGLNYVKLDGQVGIIGNGAGLVMSTLDVVAYAGREPRRCEARELPRHRRRRLCHRHGGGPGRHPRRPAGQERLRQCLRRHHLVRGRGGGHRQGARDPRRHRDQAARRAPGRQPGRRGPRDPRRGEQPARDPRRRHGRGRRQGRRAGRRLIARIG
ncbi:succinyl-CoA synthetase beta subunit [Microbacterium sp. SORGH_AS 862]|nr:succinyl-CoA synthetase beta subunit [Microbacterium sp. SORGH_AS_0862]